MLDNWKYCSCKPYAALVIGAGSILSAYSLRKKYEKRKNIQEDLDVKKCASLLNPCVSIRNYFQSLKGIKEKSSEIVLNKIFNNEKLQKNLSQLLTQAIESEDVSNSVSAKLDELLTSNQTKSMLLNHLKSICTESELKTQLINYLDSIGNDESVKIRFKKLLSQTIYSSLPIVNKFVKTNNN